MLCIVFHGIREGSLSSAKLANSAAVFYVEFPTAEEPPFQLAGAVALLIRSDGNNVVRG